MALPPNYYGGSAVPMGTQPFNAQRNTQSTYGAGLGGIQQYGYANPYGPYSGLAKATTGGGMPTAGGGSSTTTTGNADAEAWLKNVMAGNNLPFSPQQQAAMLTQQSDMGAAAESARNQSLDANAAASGASGRDPSLQGAKAANFAARQVGNQRAAGDIATKANSANFGAQMNAAETLNNNAMTRAAWQQSGGGASAFLPWNAGRGGGGGTGVNNFNYGPSAYHDTQYPYFG